MNQPPAARGPLSDALLRFLVGESPRIACWNLPRDARADGDLQLALYLCYELHYGGLPWAAVDPEWDPELLRFRGMLEARFETSVRAAVGPVREVPGRPMDVQLRAIVGGHGGVPLPTFLARHATVEHYREFLLHRSAYHLKEADPFTWAIPRLRADTKSALVQIQADEYGGGDAAWMHSRLFADAMVALGLDPATAPPLELLPGSTLATVNLISLFGLHRRLRGALVGHLAAFEMTSCIPNRAYGDGLRRLGFGDDATRFFDEHVEADAAHEAIAANDLAGSLAADEPGLAPDILFGARAMLVTDDRASELQLRAWRAGQSSFEPERARAASAPIAS